jgi:hypothetical protein
MNGGAKIMNKSIKIIIAVIVAAILIGGAFYLGSSQKGARVGAIPSVTAINYSHFTGTIYAGGDIVEGGGSFATSSLTAGDALVEAEFLPDNLIQYTPTNISVTLTLPVFTNLLTNVGDEESTYVQNLASTTGVTVTFAAPSLSTVLQLATTTPVLQQNAVGKLECMRTSTATTTCILY